MHDFRYEFSSLYDRYAGIVAQQAAVISPLFGVPPNRRYSVQSWDRLMGAIRKAWHRRLFEWQALGWERVRKEGKRLTWMRNCPPFGGQYRPFGQPCNLTRYCPFCRGRQAGSLYTRLRHKLLAGLTLGVVQDAKLWKLWYFRWRRPIGSLIDLCEQKHFEWLWTSDYAPQIAFHRNTWGVARSMYPDQVAKDVDSWYMQYHVVAVVWAGSKPPRDLLDQPEFLGRQTPVTGANLAQAVGQMLAYQPGWLHGPAEPWLEVLKATQRMRSFATFKQWRGLPPETPETGEAADPAEEEFILEDFDDAQFESQFPACEL